MNTSESSRKNIETLDEEEEEEEEAKEKKLSKTSILQDTRKQSIQSAYPRLLRSDSSYDETIVDVKKLINNRIHTNQKHRLQRTDSIDTEIEPVILQSPNY
jgi:hypothetical protein